MARRMILLPIVLVILLVLVGCSLPIAGEATPQPVIVIVTATPDPNAPQTSGSADPGLQATIESLAATATAVAAAPAPPPGDGTTPAPPPQPTGVLQRVRERGVLICGTNADLPGFGFYDNVRDTWSGFDVDFCRAVAAAVLGDADAIEFVGLNTSGRNERFAAIRSGQVDVLFRNTTWTLGRDLADLAFGPTTFHDGQTFMVRADSGITTSNDLEGARICVSAGTTSEQNLNDDFAARGIRFTAVLFDDENLMYPAYNREECDAVTSDSSQLASKRQTLSDPSDHIVLGERISREPLGPAFIENDEQWRDIVSWTVFATMYAEELRVDRSNVDQLRRTSEDPRVRRLLGLEGDFGNQLGLENDFAYQIIRQVGSYADIYDRNLGPNTLFALDRGPNKAWNLGAGGVLASPPFR